MYADPDGTVKNNASYFGKVSMNSEESVADLQPETSSLARIRQLGAYYTPETIASAIASWAIRSGNESVLEPSAGAGALICAAQNQAKKVSSACKLRITAFDIDQNAIDHLRKLAINELNVHHLNFLAAKPDQYERVDLVLANPPFTRNHSLLPGERQIYRDRFGTKGAVGIWVHFLLHSLAFLKRGGRLASIVPRSVLFTVHGQKLLQDLSLMFSKVGAYELSSKPNWSHYAEEAGAVILADGYECGGYEAYERGVLDENGIAKKYSSNNSAYFNRILNRSSPLEEFVFLSIGAVTGRNSVFLLNQAEKAAAELSDADVRPIVSRRRQISGVTLTKADLQEMAEKGERTWLLAPSELNDRVDKYLKVVPETDRQTVVWFRKRNPWWKVQLAPQYDAVFTYMNDLGPRLVKLESDIVCTNTLHRVEFKKSTSTQEKIAALLSPISTFGQLAAEKIGRAYSGGVLKFELSDAKSLPIVRSPLFDDQLLNKVDLLLRKEKGGNATATVDAAFMPSLFGDEWRNALAELEAELIALRNARRKVKRISHENGN